MSTTTVVVLVLNGIIISGSEASKGRLDEEEETVTMKESAELAKPAKDIETLPIVQSIVPFWCWSMCAPYVCEGTYSRLLRQVASSSRRLPLRCP